MSCSGRTEGKSDIHYKHSYFSKNENLMPLQKPIIWLLCQRIMWLPCWPLSLSFTESFTDLIRIKIAPSVKLYRGSLPSDHCFHSVQVCPWSPWASRNSWWLPSPIGSLPRSCWSHVQCNRVGSGKCYQISLWCRCFMTLHWWGWQDKMQWKEKYET